MFDLLLDVRWDRGAGLGLLVLLLQQRHHHVQLFLDDALEHANIDLLVWLLLRIKGQRLLDIHLCILIFQSLLIRCFLTLRGLEEIWDGLLPMFCRGQRFDLWMLRWGHGWFSLFLMLILWWQFESHLLLLWLDLRNLMLWCVHGFILRRFSSGLLWHGRLVVLLRLFFRWPRHTALNELRMCFLWEVGILHQTVGSDKCLLLWNTSFSLCGVLAGRGLIDWLWVVGWRYLLWHVAHWILLLPDLILLRLILQTRICLWKILDLLKILLLNLVRILMMSRKIGDLVVAVKIWNHTLLMVLIASLLSIGVCVVEVGQVAIYWLLMWLLHFQSWSIAWTKFSTSDGLSHRWIITKLGAPPAHGSMMVIISSSLSLRQPHTHLVSTLAHHRVAAHAGVDTSWPVTTQTSSLVHPLILIAHSLIVPGICWLAISIGGIEQINSAIILLELAICLVLELVSGVLTVVHSFGVW